jgi:hypothetical protein
MTTVVLVIVLLATAVVVCLGIVFTLRAFRAGDRPPVERMPRQVRGNPHDPAATAELKHFFEGKSCASCNRPIPPVQAGQMRPGLVDPNTHQTMAWNQIPTANLAATLRSHQAICSNCLTLETFRQQHPELVVDRHRTIESPSH